MCVLILTVLCPMFRKLMCRRRGRKWTVFPETAALSHKHGSTRSTLVASVTSRCVPPRGQLALEAHVVSVCGLARTLLLLTVASRPMSNPRNCRSRRVSLLANYFFFLVSMEFAVARYHKNSCCRHVISCFYVHGAD